MLSKRPNCLWLYGEVPKRFMQFNFFSVAKLLLTTGPVFVQLPSSIREMTYSNTNI